MEASKQSSGEIGAYGITIRRNSNQGITVLLQLIDLNVKKNGLKA